MRALVRFLLPLGALLFAEVSLAVERPLFQLPLAAKVTERSPKGDTWRESGVIKAPYVHSVGQFKSALARDGWSFVREIALQKPAGRSLIVWKRGKNEITLMLWRIKPRETGFSWGVSQQKQ